MIGIIKSLPRTTDSFLSSADSDPISRSSVTNMGCLPLSITTPIMGRMHGCLSLDNNRISL